MSRAIRVLLITLLTGVLALLAAFVVIPKIMGWVPLAVLTGSMRPGIPPGSQIVVARVEPDQLDRIGLGDVITFLPHPGEPMLVTHRVVQVHQLSDGTRTFVTKGDDNPSTDPEPVTGQQIRGKLLYHLPLLGYLTTALGSGDKGLLVTVIAVGLLGYALWQIGGALTRGRAGRHRRTG